MARMVSLESLKVMPTTLCYRLPAIWKEVELNATKATGNVLVSIVNKDKKSHAISINDNSYNTGNQTKIIAAGTKMSVVLNLSKNHNWYDFSIKLKDYHDFEERFAGHVETGEVTKTDPLMGRMV